MRHLILTTTALLLSAGLALAPTVRAHGTNEPGPHGGEIRMPGAFHVEALAGDEALRIYVLDMQFGDPTVENASLEATIVQGGTERKLSCEAGADVKAFVCSLPGNTTLDQGNLIIDAQRGGKPGEPAEYDLPLEWSGE